MCHQINRFSLIVLSLVLVSACSNTKYLKKNEALLVSHSIAVNKPDSVVDKRNLSGDMLDLTTQQPNEKFLFTRYRQWVYNVTDSSESKFIQGINNRTGKKPVVLDTAALDADVIRLEQYLFNKGYFESEVSYEVKVRNQKARVKYHAVLNDLTRIRNVTYHIPEERLKRVALINVKNSPLKAGKPYDIDFLMDERTRITANMRDQGYLYFGKQYVYFDVDTLFSEDELDISVRIIPPNNDTGHVVYYIGDIYIFPQTMKDMRPEAIDTSQFRKVVIPGRDITIFSNDLQYHPRSLADAVFLTSGEIYKLKRHQLTINRLSGLGVFDLVKIDYANARDYGPHKMVDAYIFLAPSIKQTITIEQEVSTTDQIFTQDDENAGIGLLANIGYRNRNFLGYADLLKVNVSGGFETFLSRDTSGGNVNTGINTFVFNTDAKLIFPKFVQPFGRISGAPLFNPKTIFGLSYQYYSRFNAFKLHTITGQYGFEWKVNAPIRHVFNLIEINVTKPFDIQSGFDDILENNPSLRQSFQNQLIIGSNYTFTYNSALDPVWKDKKNDIYFRGRLDVAGNSIVGINYLFTGEDTVSLFGQRLAHYVRPESEFVYTRNLTKKVSLVGRVYGGFGWALPDSTAVLPYIKQFVVGGSNSIRAYRLRSVGPGGFNPTEAGLTETESFFEQTGEMKLEANVELRFPLGGLFEGAIFFDAGNIWLLRDIQEAQKPNSVFRLNSTDDHEPFYQQIALGSGAGLRVDFTFFIFRLDFGFPIYNPSIADPWAINSYQPFSPGWYLDNMSLNLAVGYPF